MNIIQEFDTIAAIATPIGTGGVGVIRISGEKTYEILSKIYNKTNIETGKKKPSLRLLINIVNVLDISLDYLVMNELENKKFKDDTCVFYGVEEILAIYKAIHQDYMYDNTIITINGERWIKTGDRVSIDTDGNVKFIGRNNLISTAQGLNSKLSNYVGDNLDPIMSLRNKIVVPANDSVTVYLLIGFGRSREQIIDIIDAYNTKSILDKEFKISTLMNVIDTKTLNITGSEMRTYNTMLNFLYQTTRISVNDERMDLLRKNALGQSGLWKFGVSGDRPTVTVDIFDITDMGFVRDMLKAFEYYKNKSVFIDLIIINNETGEYQKLIKKEIEDELYRMYTLNSFYHTPGSVTVINSSNITKEERSLLDMVPRLKFDITNHITLKEAVEKEFSPEFRNRLDAIIPFNYLDKNVAKLVCKKEINKLAERLKKQKVDLFVTDNCIDYLTELGYSKEFGARNMTRVIEDKIANQLVDEVLFGKLEKGGKVTATLKDADIIFEIN